MSDISIIGLDLAKRKFHLVGVDEKGKKQLTHKLPREEMHNYFRTLVDKNILIAMEACGGSNYWARELMAMGFTVKLLKTTDIKPYARSRQKNDCNDSLAIARAAKDPELKEVRVKSKEEQGLSWLHKKRQNIIKERVRIGNFLMASLLEFGFDAKAKKAAFSRAAGDYVNTAYKIGAIDNVTYEEMLNIAAKIKELFAQEFAVTKKLVEMNKHNPRAKLLQTIPGIGDINASILSVAAFEHYDECRSFAASFGLVPKQNSTGGNISLGSITKRGDRYIRSMLIQGGRSIAIQAVIMARAQKNAKDKLVIWAQSLLKRMSFNKACVALANKLARIAYACVTQGKVYAG